MHLLDSHCHFPVPNDSEKIDLQLENAAQADVCEVIAIGTDTNDWQAYHNLASRRKDVHWTCGLHPSHVKENWEESLDTMQKILHSATLPPCAVGEIGLDFTRLPKQERETMIQWQKEAFGRQLATALEKNLPVVIHSRGTAYECIELMKEHKFSFERSVFHCFSEGPDMAKVLLDHGANISFTGILTFRSADKVREAARLVGVDRLLLETDSPWLSPEPFRGKINEPSRIRVLAEYCAGLFNCPLEEIAEKTTRNSKRFFRL